MEKNMFFVIPEMPSKTFVMVLKKLLDHFNIVISVKFLFRSLPTMIVEHSPLGMLGSPTSLRVALRLRPSTGTDIRA